MVVVGEPVAAVRQAQHPVRVAVLAGQQRGAAAASRRARRRTPGGTAVPGRRAAGCSASGPGDRTAGCGARCRANAGRRCSDAKSCNPIEYVRIDRVRDPAQRQHAAVRAAEGHRRRRHPERVLPALQGHRTRRPAAPVPGGRRRSVGAGRCCRRSTRACPRRRSTSRPCGGRARRPTASSRPRSCGATPTTCGRGSAARTLEDVFGPLRYVQVMRRDKVAQAVSLWTAIQTQAWRSGDEPAARAGLLVRGDPASRRLAVGGRARLDGVAARAASRTSSSTRTSRATRRRRSRSSPGVPRSGAAAAAPVRRRARASGSRASLQEAA